MKRVRGFTLIELMIVVAVIAILSIIALSVYTKQIRKGRRADGKQAIAQLFLREEKWRTNHTKYYGTDSSAADTTAFGVMPAGTYYTIALTLAESQTNFTITATPIGDQAKDPCGTLTFQSASGVVTKLPSTQGCWQ
jgi:type IV pilus assembly protein PilE